MVVSPTVDRFWFARSVSFPRQLDEIKLTPQTLGGRTPED